MKFVSVVLVLVALSVPSTGSEPNQKKLTSLEIRGHQVGENLSEFLAIEKTQEAIQGCTQILEESLAKETALRDCEQKRDKSKACRKLTKEKPDFSLQHDLSECKSVAAVVNGGSAQLGAGTLKLPFAGSAAFVLGKLVQLEIAFWDTPGAPHSFVGGYSSIASDCEAKFGPPTNSWSDEFQNGFGARFDQRRAVWESDSAYVYLEEIDEKGNSVLYFRDRAFFEAAKKDAAARHRNVLDQ